MTIAATIMMLCIMTFRLPGAALGAYYTLVISRDNTHATLEGGITILGAIALALAEVLAGVMLFSGSPVMHFLWVVASLFTIFFLISAATRYNFATSFGFLVVVSIPIWDFPANTETAVTSTLYAALSVTLGAVITVVLELLFAALSPQDPIGVGVDQRLRLVGMLLRNIHNPDPQTKAKIVQYADIGMGQLRRFLARTEAGNEDYSRKAVLIGLTGRLVDLCAGFLSSNSDVSEIEQTRLHETAGRIDQIRRWGALSGAKSEEHAPLSQAGTSFVELMESTVQLMNDALEQPALLVEYTVKEDVPTVRLLKRDAFSNPEHLKFAMRGTAAALLCFVAYHLLDWRGLYNSMATCMVTALSTAGSSRQKQILRIAGAITGGLLLGMASEVFLLPYIDSIGEFSLLFGAVTLFAAWFATASPRLSYYGLQVAFAFDVVQLRTFAPDRQLIPARDNVAGILLGLIVMWLVFDQLTAHNSLVDMKGALIRGIRALTAYMREPRGASPIEYLKRARRFRDVVNESFLNVRTSADSVLFEFDRNRAEALKLRANVRAWQPQLRTLFLLQITLAHMRLREPSGVLPDAAERLLSVCAAKLDAIADTLEGGTLSGDSDAEARETRPTESGGIAESLVLDSLVIAKDLLRQVRSAVDKEG
jgi:multidrug resistance protein MdtO